MKNRILLIVTGSVAAFKAAALASKLSQEGYTVTTVLSAGAKEFIGASTFEGLTGNRVYTSTFAEGDAMEHIALARAADLTLVYPASANTVAKMANGLATDLVGTLFLAMNLGRETSGVRRNTVWIAPAMNPTMLAHPATRANLSKLSEWGCEVVEGEAGRLACGETGSGRLIEPEKMLERVQGFFSGLATERSLGRKILITAGGTSEKIDPVRVLSNTSTGETGVRLANQFASAGASVTLLLSARSPFSSAVSAEVRLLRFESFEDLDREMQTLLGEGIDDLFHAAAVSDYAVERIETFEGKELEKTQKIHSGERLRLILRPNPKILDRVRSYSSNPALRIVSFKLSTSSADAIDLSGYSSDYVVHNAVADIERGTSNHRGEIFKRGERAGSGSRFSSLVKFRTKDELGSELLRLMEGSL